ncbi:MBL fold metallo-hydrolase (plasmid) [Halorussus limi]|uniref:MBL fold metallo-hydrolase n=1 Tax=Halorussus limi TaxID=2938695 RepID=A0A8U0HZE3_9EURY|nr:MBL fold metallo-hydrolase [Halorussus limi]UPV76390.1 MBL fold metallo-hydrolase [Halorussus limi]
MKRIQLGNTVFEGQNDAYLFDRESGPTALVDTGVATDEAREQLRDGLAEYGREFADLDLILLTHWHHDHAGLAGEIQDESGATVYVHEDDAPMVTGDGANHRAEIEERDLFERWGVPDEKATELLEFLGLHDEIQGDSPTVETFTDGETFDLGGVELRAVHLPGHAAGLTGFEFAEDGETHLLSGDALLPKYTPNVGGADPRVEDPLGTYLDSLARIVEADYDRAWPGHRDSIKDPAGRAREIAVHHRERTERVLSVLRERDAPDAWTVSADLFGELSNIHIMHGPGEAWAHLDHLEREGVVERSDGEGRYELVESDPDLDAMFEYGDEGDESPVTGATTED